MLECKLHHVRRSQSPGKESPSFAEIQECQPTPQKNTEHTNTDLNSTVSTPWRSQHCARTFAAVWSGPGVPFANRQAASFPWPCQGTRAAKSVVFTASLFRDCASTLLKQTDVPCVAHFISQQHIVRTWISDANSVQIPFRMHCSWQKPMPPRTYGKLSYFSCTLFFTLCSTCVNWLPASHSLCIHRFEQVSQLFITSSTVWLKIDQILAFSLHLIMPFGLYSNVSFFSSKLA